eukprot:PhF_6_TR6183/c0_g1_i1/m.9273/K00624/E2.3.1.7; carnitine O-acetyltransferase
MYWDDNYTFSNDDAVRTPNEPYIHPSEARSAFGWTDSLSPDTHSSVSQHQSKLPRLPIPTLEETCSLYLDSLIGICTAEEFSQAKKSVEDFLRPGGIGEQLQHCLQQKEKEMSLNHSSPSWLEPWWDDAYLCGRDPIPINVNYCFGLEDHPGGKECMNQTWRAAALLHSAMEVCLEIRQGKFPLDCEKTPSGEKSPLDVSQLARVFGASRVPSHPRDFIVTYTTVRPCPADVGSTTSQYVPIDPTHVIVMCRNRFFKIDVIEGNSVIPIERIESSLQKIHAECSQRPKGGPPVGLFTTQHRSVWAQYRTELTANGNLESLDAIQSALLVVVLDSVHDVTLDEHARVCLHGSGTNRWFDKHQLIVTQGGQAGFCFEHSVGDGATTLTIVDEIFKRHKKYSNSASAAVKSQRVSEISWRLSGTLDTALRDSFEEFKKLVLATHVRVLNFTSYGGNFIKLAKMSPDAFVQVAFQLTYYKMYGRNDATYESASTRSFLHGRTETVRSVTPVVSDFCHSVTTQPLFPPHARTTVPQSMALFRKATEAHVTFMKKAKGGKGVDRHMLGLRMICLEQGIEFPPLFTDVAFAKSSRWRLSTSHCGSPNLKLFGFGPVVPDGYGLGYMIKNDMISVTVTSNSSHAQGSSVLFVRMLEST